jgi:hypothetical protein
MMELIIRCDKEGIRTYWNGFEGRDSEWIRLSDLERILDALRTAERTIQNRIAQKKISPAEGRYIIFK